MKKKKILLYGVGSLKNRGCEALVNSTINQISTDYDIVSASFDYEFNKDKYKDRIKKHVNHHRHNEEELSDEEKKLKTYYDSIPFDYYNYESLYEKDVIDEIKTSDICLHVGGDNYCYGVNEWIYTITRKANELNSKVVLWGASLYDEIKDVDLINDLCRYDLLMIRESISYNAIKKYVPEDKIMLLPDPAFSLEPKKVKLNDWYKNKKILGLNLSPLTIKTDEQYESVKELIKYVLKNTDYNIALLPHVTLDEASDLIILNRLKDDFKNEPKVFLESDNYDCQELKYIISQCDMIITARTHASIAAYSSNIPTLVIGYSVKSKGIALDLFGSYKNYVLPNEEITSESLIRYFNFINDNYKEIKTKLTTVMKKYKKDSQTLFEKMIQRLNENDKKVVCNPKKCTGCTACMNSCPKKAITMVENEEGFIVPKIDLNKCIECNICRKVCPAIKNESYKKKEIKCYVAKSKDDNILKKSSSGGIFSHLANEVLSNNGIVYGAKIDNLKVSHIRVTNKDELNLLNGSKYSESKLNTIFQSVKKDLDDNKNVLFSGTPCQILGLNSFLNKDYKNLITVGVICHGAINDKLLERRVKEFEYKFNSIVDKVKYKSKKNGWDISSIEYTSDKVDKCYPFNDDSLMRLYLKNVILRESCYRCPAKGENNISDIVLGDYWGVYNEHPNFFDKKGVSAVIIKTEKGNKLFNKIKKELILDETQYEKIVKYNTAYLESVKRPSERSIIFEELKNNSLELLSDKYEHIDKKYDALKKELELSNNELEEKRRELSDILNSRRYRLASKLANIKKKFRRK